MNNFIIGFIITDARRFGFEKLQMKDKALTFGTNSSARCNKHGRQFMLSEDVDGLVRKCACIVVKNYRQ